MTASWRDQAVALLAAAKNHGDLALKISSLRQVKDILASVDPASAADLFPYIADLQSSPESLVRRCLVELIEDLSLKVVEQSLAFMPTLLQVLKDNNSEVVKQTIVSSTNIFCSILDKALVQIRESGRIENWHQELLSWLGRFTDSIYTILLETVSIGTRLLALKFMETCVLFFTSDAASSEATLMDGKGSSFVSSWPIRNHPILDPAKLTLEANKIVGFLVDLLHSASILRGCMVIAVINCLAVIARKRPIYYSKILSVLFGFEPTFDPQKGGHAASIQNSLRTAFLGFLRGTHPHMIESREKLLRALRAMNAGEAADQVLRQVDKLLKNSERTASDARIVKEDPSTSQRQSFGDFTRKKLLVDDRESQVASDEILAKRARYNAHANVLVNGTSSKMPTLENELTALNPTEQMIAMIGALLGEGERGAQSLEVLISNIHPDLMADIVIANMKHLPQNPPLLLNKIVDFPVASQSAIHPTLSQATAAASFSAPFQSPMAPSQILAASSHLGSSALAVDSASMVEVKRDPRRDPRRMDPRLVAVTNGEQTIKSESTLSELQFRDPDPSSLGISLVHEVRKLENLSEAENLENSKPPSSNAPSLLIPEEVTNATDEINAASCEAVFPEDANDNEKAPSSSSDATEDESEDFSLFGNQLSTEVISEENLNDLPILPSYVDLSEKDKNEIKKAVMQRIVEAYKKNQSASVGRIRQTVLAHLIALPEDDFVAMLPRYILSDYQRQKGHDVVLDVLHHLYTINLAESVEHFNSRAGVIYEMFLLAVARSLWDTFPASDKSFIKLLGEVPYLPNSVLRLLEELCLHDGLSKDIRDKDRITQGLGAVWTLIIGRPPVRRACLDIALKCAVHSEDDIRTMAIRLVTNKLYHLDYASLVIEKFATNMLLSIVDNQPSDSDAKIEVNIGSQEPSVGGCQSSELGVSGSDLGQVNRSSQTTVITIAEARRCSSLFFALCPKKPFLLKVVFEVYGRAAKTVKETVDHHMTGLLRNLDSFYQELLGIISDPPQGSKNLLVTIRWQVLEMLSEEISPPKELISTVWHLFETKLKDPIILVPLLSSFSKEEVLPIFPQLVGLPLNEFQVALARILQGSAHTGPALTPAEVLVTIHGINPEKDGIPLKKITDACSACFEQRTVFTQHVLAKSLDQLVEQTPLPLLFMRTVIQTVDAFPALVDFVMELLSKLVRKQIWKMPKLWVGFLKCASQTAPHSFRVLLELPPPQLENVLNKHVNLRSSLANYAKQPNVRTSLPRSTLAVLGLGTDSQPPRSYLSSTEMQSSQTLT